MELREDKNIYQQVTDLVERDILRGTLKADDQAPSTNQFAKVYKINPATALKGLNQLVEEGILYKKRGLGLFVTDQAREKVMSKRKREFLKNQLPELLKEARRLGISTEELIKNIREELEND